MDEGRGKDRGVEEDAKAKDDEDRAAESWREGARECGRKGEPKPERTVDVANEAGEDDA